MCKKWKWKPKLTALSSVVGTAHVSVRMTMHSSDVLGYPLQSHHWWTGWASVEWHWFDTLLLCVTVQTMEMARNPAMLQELMRQQDRAISNLEVCNTAFVITRTCKPCCITVCWLLATQCEYLSRFYMFLLIFKISRERVSPRVKK